MRALLLFKFAKIITFYCLKVHFHCHVLEIINFRRQSILLILGGKENLIFIHAVLLKFVFIRLRYHTKYRIYINSAYRRAKPQARGAMHSKGVMNSHPNPIAQGKALLILFVLLLNIKNDGSNISFNTPHFSGKY